MEEAIKGSILQSVSIHYVVEYFYSPAYQLFPPATFTFHRQPAEYNPLPDLDNEYFIGKHFIIKAVGAFTIGKYYGDTSLIYTQ
ncbi:MAG: hypothetical protein IPH84_19740 [Bacteroidales bacterium]|nr:hypothetical protein [Bacteroidales bacterium]